MRKRYRLLPGSITALGEREVDLKVLDDRSQPEDTEDERKPSENDVVAEIRYPLLEDPDVTVRIGPGIVAYRKGPGGEAVSSTSAQGETIVVDTRTDGLIESAVKAKPPQGEEGGAGVVRTLIRHLNELHGTDWGDPVDVTETIDDVDFLVRDDSKTLRVQITKAETDKGLWQKLARTGGATPLQSPIAMADSLRAGNRG